MKSKRIVIFGAQSFARGIGNALRELYSDFPIERFLVTSLVGNPTTVLGIPVSEIAVFSAGLTEEEKGEIVLLVATPEDIFEEISVILEMYGFKNPIYMDSRKEAILMARYFKEINKFPLLKDLSKGSIKSVPKVYQVKHYNDKKLKKEYDIPVWCVSLQVGAALTEERIVNITDDTGDNISDKNPNYCELTAFYWMWKNCLPYAKEDDYFGLFHYRRGLDITEEDLYRLKKNEVDVILPYPTMHEPDIKEHHKRYVKEEDWQAMLQALREVEPEYADAYERIFAGEFFYNYNMVIAKKGVLEDYCRWMFSILKRTEELSNPRGWERGDRYTAYMGESLTTLYFLFHAEDLNIVHTGRYMLT